MKSPQIALVCHFEVDSQYALEVLDENGYGIVRAIQLQMSLRKEPHVIFTDDSGKQSLLYYVGNRDFMLRSGLPVATNAEYFGLAMPADCELARELKSTLVESGNTFVLSPCHS